MINKDALARVLTLTALLSLGACGGKGGDGGSGSGGVPPVPATTYTIGGTVTGLSGSGLGLQNNAADDIVIAADGSFQFPGALASGSSYNVAVATQPTGPHQTCTVINGNGVVGTIDVSSIQVNCTTNAYTVGGHVSGLVGGVLVLQNNGADDLATNADGGFAFVTLVPSGERYHVSLASVPAGQSCTLNNVSGEIVGENITTVSVNCSAVTYTIGGTVTGLLAQDLQSAGLRLINNASDPLSIYEDGSFTFAVPQVSGSSYTVAVAFQPTSPAQTCVVTPDSFHGDVTNSDITSIVVECLPINTSGSLDADFGIGGIALVDFGFAQRSDAQPAAIIVQPDNKIVVAGTVITNASTDFGLFRLNADGTLDSSFNNGANDGFVRTNVAGAADQVRAVALQSTGKIVVAGFSIVSGGWDFSLARYDNDGNLDISFGNGGVTTLNLGTSFERGLAMAIQNDDKIVVVGYRPGAGEDFAIARLTESGAPDETFNGGDPANTSGFVTTDFNGGHDRAQAVAIQFDGRIVVAGYANNDFAVARYNDDGSLDLNFGANANGKVTTNLGSVDRGQAMVIQPTGEIVVAGFTGVGSTLDFALVRYTSNGQPDDLAFGTGGIVTSDIGGKADQAYSLVLDANNKLVVVGSSHNGINDDFVLVRYDPTGALDSSFGAGGIVTTGVGGGEDVAYGVVIQPDGKIVTVGEAENGANTDFAVARVHP